MQRAQRPSESPEGQEGSDADSEEETPEENSALEEASDEDGLDTGLEPLDELEAMNAEESGDQ